MEDRLQQSFSQAASSLTAFYKEIQQEQEKRYSQGREDSLRDVHQWANQLLSMDLKYVPVSALLEAMSKYKPDFKLREFPDSRKRNRDQF
jgi:hypothetical protein